ncbi:MAG TPA: 5-formyltetrahydrofolate cyclo-ligase [Acidimicrobiia bacterium]|nr:5-formyltetrahydrofolate cyclo-ligase [Acidimicrobiia bacterium]
MALRAAMRGVGSITPDVERAVVRGLFEWLSARVPGTVSAFLAMTGEVDVSPLFERLPGWRWVLPRVEPDRTMTFRDRDVPRERHRFGMEQPGDVGPVIAVHEIDIFLTPGLAFDRRGGRLGNGAGFYDRVLSTKRGDAIAVGVTVMKHLVDEVPMETHDQRIDWLATETGVRECSIP